MYIEEVMKGRDWYIMVNVKRCRFDFRLELYLVVFKFFRSLCFIFLEFENLIGYIVNFLIFDFEFCLILVVMVWKLLLWCYMLEIVGIVDEVVFFIMELFDCLIGCWKYKMINNKVKLLDYDEDS